MKWIPEKDAWLKQNYAHTDNEVLAQELQCTVAAITNRAHTLGLKKNGNAGCFKKGMTPHNKDKPMPTEVRAKLTTCFKKGNIPHNTLPVGSERTDTDGYLFVKTAMPDVWMAKHHMEFDEVPEGHKVIFLDGNKRNFNKENLAIVSNAEHMDRNTIHRYPNELKNALRTLSKLNKRLKAKTQDLQNA